MFKKKAINFFSKEIFDITLAKDILSCIESVQENQSNFHLILSGGKTPINVHREIVRQSRQHAISWDKVIFFFSDERCVPPDHESSTYRMANETLFQPLQIPSENIYRIKGEVEPSIARREYEVHIRNILTPSKACFDLALLGMGPDGHTASLFPFSKILSNVDQLVGEAGKGPEGIERVSLTFTALNFARRSWIMVAGNNKKTAFTDISDNCIGMDIIPVKGIQPTDELLFYTFFEKDLS